MRGGVVCVCGSGVPVRAASTMRRWSRRRPAAASGAASAPASPACGAAPPPAHAHVSCTCAYYLLPT